MKNVGLGGLQSNKFPGFQVSEFPKIWKPAETSRNQEYKFSILLMWTGWTGTTLQGSLQWNSMDLLRTRLISRKLQAATAAIEFVASHVRPHSDALQV